MSEIAPAREWALSDDLEAGRIEQRAPHGRGSEGARACAVLPLAVMNPAHHAIQPATRDVFVDYDETTMAQDAPHLTHDQAEVLRVMQHVAEQDRIEALVRDRKALAVVTEVFYRRGGAFRQIYSQDWHAEHGGQVVCYESVAAAHVEHARGRGYKTRHFERHVVGAAHGATATLAPPATMQAADRAREEFGGILERGVSRR
jgi:hypothetical protein